MRANTQIYTIRLVHGKARNEYNLSRKCRNHLNYSSEERKHDIQINDLKKEIIAGSAIYTQREIQTEIPRQKIRIRESEKGVP